MNSEQKRLFLAVSLSAVVLFGWQAFFAPKQMPKKEVVEAAKTNNTDETQAAPVSESTASNIETNKDAKTEEKSTEPFATHILANGKYKVHVTSDLEVREYVSENTKFFYYDITGSEKAFQLYLINPSNVLEKINFTFEDSSSTNVLQGKSDKYDINLILTLTEDGKTLFNFSSPKAYRYRVKLNSSSAELDNRQVRNFITFTKDVETYTVGDEEKIDGTFKWLGIDFNYHLFAVVFGEKTVFRVNTNEMGSLTADTAKALNSFQFDLLFTQKDYDLLTAYGDSLNMSVDFGIFGVIGVPILRGLQWLYRYIPNYGIGIILLTLFIRLITFPLQYKSFKSMKKMQKVQPELAKLKEKFKDDPQRMQKETMELFKRAGANPLGGCLPMLLQMPILFAFYQVLYNAVELVGAPFAGWITDLSVKDPMYVLPVLCAVTMFLNQKLTPTATADPTQKKVMMFMPLFFGFIMKDLPSGLVLYIVVSTVFGMAQQLLVYKTTD